MNLTRERKSLDGLQNRLEDKLEKLQCALSQFLELQAVLDLVEDLDNHGTVPPEKWRALAEAFGNAAEAAEAAELPNWPDRWHKLQDEAEWEADRLDEERQPVGG